MSFCSGLEHSCSPAAFLRLSSTDCLEQNSSLFRGRGLWWWWLFYALQDVEQHPSSHQMPVATSLAVTNKNVPRHCQMPLDSGEYKTAPVKNHCSIDPVLIHLGCYNKNTTDQRPKQQTFISSNSEGQGVQDQGASGLGIWWGPTSWFIDHNLPAVLSYGGTVKGDLWGAFYL